MGEWCAENLRGVEGWRASGLEMTTTSDECAKMFDATLRQLISWIKCTQLGSWDITLNKAQDADPQAHAEKSGNRREKLHARAAAKYALGFFRDATVIWEQILKEWPNDLMAIKFAHDAYFFLGDAKNKRDGIARIIDKVRKDEPCYSYLHGMYAFGLEECGEYKKAEQHALTRQDCWSTHARAHCMEMNGRTKEGILFMESTVADWEPCYMLATHNFWHNSIFYIEDAMYEPALTLFDKEIEVRQADSKGMLDYVDAASLLWRLELEGVNVGNRWHKLFDVQPHLDNHVIVFNDLHFGPALYRQDKGDQAEYLRNSLHNFITTSSGDNRDISERVGLQLYDGMAAFANEKFDEAARLMLPIRDHVVEIGGSNAQTLLHACLNSDDKELLNQGLVVLAERDRLKTNSGIAERLAEKFKHKMRCSL